MSGLFGTLNVGSKGMQASQTALQTTSHNISNANTEGYSRQRVDLKADLAFTFGGVGQLGTGVKMNSIVRTVDDYVTRQIRQENGTAAKFGAKSEMLEQLEIIYNEPSDTSLNFNLGEMFDAWTELSKNPELLTSKSIVVEKSKTTADTLNHISNQLEGLKTDTTELIDINANNFNEIVEGLNTLNNQIFNISVKGQVPNDLLDQRDLLLKNLSSITDFKTDFNDKYGRVEISIGTNDILTASGVGYKMDAYDTGVVQLVSTDVTNPNTVDLVSKKGYIAGYQDALAEIDEQISKLEDFAVTMSDAINFVHGVGEPIFSSKDGGSTITAKNIQINTIIQNNNDLIQAGAIPGGPEGDGSRALAIARVRDVRLTKGMDLEFKTGTMNLVGDPNGVTIEGAYNSMVTNVGISKQQADNMVANQEILLDQLIMRRESTSGVSIDEEVTNLIKFQSAFEANARVIQTISEMLDTLINRTGV